MKAANGIEKIIKSENHDPKGVKKDVKAYDHIHEDGKMDNRKPIGRASIEPTV